MLRDATNWPSAVLEEILQVPSVELLPIALAAPLYDKDHSIPNPIAYVPQFGSGLHPNMVCSLASLMYSIASTCSRFLAYFGCHARH